MLSLTAAPDDPWRKVDRRLNQLLLWVLLPIILLQALRPPQHWASDPVLWLSVLLFVICLLQASVRRLQPLARYLVPLLMVVLSTCAVWFNHPMAVLWLPVTSFLIFMYFPVRAAQWIALVAMGASLALLYQHWHVDPPFMVRALLCSLTIFGLLSLFFEANAATSAELRQTNAQLNAVLDDYGALRQRELRRTREQLVSALTQLSQYRDSETGQHIVRTQLFIERLARALVEAGQHAGELTPEAIDLIVKAAPMHDLGKIGVPDQILRKPGRHTPEEALLMRSHASIGEATLLAAAQQGEGAEHDLLQVAARIAGGHHENWDGSGYPRGLAGEAIPLEARLMAVADVYDALTTARQYKLAWSHEDACKEIRRLRDRKFDPAVVDAFEREHEAMRQIAQQYRDALEVAA